MTERLLVGVDGAKIGWIAASMNESDTKPELAAYRSFSELALALPEKAIVMIDVPIGLSDQTEIGGRSTERFCRKYLGRKGSSVFSTPSRNVLGADSYVEACEQVRHEVPDRKGISKQSWAISPKILEIDNFLQSHNDSFLLKETHPEVAFAVLNGDRPLASQKKKRRGMEERLELLEGAGYTLSREDLLRSGGGVQADDKIDACVCLHVAARYARGEAQHFDVDVKVDSCEIEQVIWA